MLFPFISVHYVIFYTEKALIVEMEAFFTKLRESTAFIIVGANTNKGEIYYCLNNINKI